MERSKLYGAISSAIFSLLVFLILWFVYMPMTVRQPEEEGIIVSFGDNFDGMGVGEALGGLPDVEPVPEQVQQTPVVAKPKPVEKQQVMTQEKEKTVTTPKQKEKPQTKKEPEIDPAQQLKEKQRREAIAAAEAKSKQEAQAAADAKKKQEAAARSEDLIGGAFGSKGTGSGTTAGDTRQGNPVGSGSSGGHGWSLTGRSLVGVIATPTYPSNVEGRVVVNIRVDENGKVTSTSVASSTNISDAQTRNAAMSAARNTRFTEGSGVSSGTITYNFKLK